MVVGSWFCLEVDNGLLLHSRGLRLRQTLLSPVSVEPFVVKSWEKRSTLLENHDENSDNNTFKQGSIG